MKCYVCILHKHVIVYSFKFYQIHIHTYVALCTKIIIIRPILTKNNIKVPTRNDYDFSTYMLLLIAAWLASQ